MRSSQLFQLFQLLFLLELSLSLQLLQLLATHIAISEPTQLLVQRQRDYDAKFAIISIIISIAIIIIIAIIGNPYCN